MTSKLPHLETSIFTLISQQAQAAGAINLSQGFPDFPVDPLLVEMHQEVLHQNCHQYTPMSGLPKLLDQLADTIQRHYGRKLQPATELLVTAGATQGLFATLTALVHQGDEVVLFDPAYDCYETPIILCGAKPIHIPLAHDFAPDWELIYRKISPKTKWMVINNPHNPSGYVWTAADFTELLALAEKHPQLHFLFDEVYEFITFNKPHLSGHQLEQLQNRLVVVSSFGKSLHITGWKIGYVAAAASLMAEIKKVHQFMVFSVNSLGQHTLSAYLDQKPLGSAAALYQPKRDLFRAGLQDTGWELLSCEGSYFQVASYQAFSAEPDRAFCTRLIEEAGVACIPLSVFYEDRLDLKRVRFCFAKTDQTLQAAIEKLQQWSNLNLKNT
ncbi:MAG: methionine aminotransferase [Flavobacterium sp. BFFFF2]|nr:MAG: methionine aminotransferase [Flavobacterium sp. BFFFF2]